LRELGLDEQMQWVKTRTGFLVDGQLHSLSSVWDFLRFPPLGLIDKLRLGWTIWHASRQRDWHELERIPVADWLTRHSGRRTFERIWLPLLKAKLGDAWQRTSAAFIWATIQRMYAARLCPQLTAAETTRLDGVEYLGIVCASLLLKKPLAGYYVTNITDPAPFTGVIEMTALIDPANIGGHTLIYLPKYATADDSAWSRTDEQIQVEFLAALGRLYPDFSPADVLAFRISRVRHVFALSTLDYSRRVPPIATSVPGLSLVNSSQIINGTLNVNETVRLAEASLASLCAPPEIDHQSPSTTHNDDQTAGELVARPG
jgi:protoporphyrinogen oxidase